MEIKTSGCHCLTGNNVSSFKIARNSWCLGKKRCIRVEEQERTTSREAEDSYETFGRRGKVNEERGWMMKVDEAEGSKCQDCCPPCHQGVNFLLFRGNLNHIY